MRVCNASLVRPYVVRRHENCGAHGGRPALSKACEPKHRLLRLRRGPMLFVGQQSQTNSQLNFGDHAVSPSDGIHPSAAPFRFGGKHHGWIELLFFSRHFFWRSHVRFVRLCNGPRGFWRVAAHHRAGAKRTSDRAVWARHARLWYLAGTSRHKLAGSFAIHCRRCTGCSRRHCAADYCQPGTLRLTIGVLLVIYSLYSLIRPTLKPVRVAS